MKVLIVTHATDLSGANKSLLSIIEKLKNKNKFVVLVNSNNGEFIDYLKKIGVEVIFENYRWWYAKKYHQWYKTLIHFVTDIFNYYLYKGVKNSVVRDIRKENFDLIYTNTSTVELGAILSKKLNIPHVWHIREFGKEDFGFIPMVGKEYIMKSVNEARFIITISNALKNKYKKYIPEDKLKVIYNGFNINELYAKPRQHDLKEKVNILIAGQVCEAKGQKEAIAAVAKLRSKGLPVKLYIAGQVDKAYLDESLSPYEDREWIEILGSVKNMYELRNTIDIELVCSRCEAFGRVTLEAMLHSIPVVASNIGGTSELIIEGKTGLLYNKGNVEELSNKIESLIKDKKLYDSIINNALEVAKTFKIEKTVDEVEKILNQAISK
ncbi:glycosyltransferase family 4 protein [Clostridium perfringens]|uniref:glycosyltransferase family 4 protein n=1 Tax=Clostridium perfringens TaxID=1502 RepID=UPI0039ECCC6C